MIEIRAAVDADKPSVREIINEVIAGGDTYTDSSEEETLRYWYTPEKHRYVAVLNGEIVGTFWLRANQPGRGSHVANAAYMVSSAARGKGVGKRMAEYSLEEAKRLGFAAMQFNFVVKSNTVAVRLWQAVGFEIIGEIPNAFRHKTNGLTNAYIMHREL